MARACQGRLSRAHAIGAEAELAAGVNGPSGSHAWVLRGACEIVIRPSIRILATRATVLERETVPQREYSRGANRQEEESARI